MNNYLLSGCASLLLALGSINAFATDTTNTAVPSNVAKTDTSTTNAPITRNSLREARAKYMQEKHQRIAKMWAAKTPAERNKIMQEQDEADEAFYAQMKTMQQAMYQQYRQKRQIRRARSGWQTSHNACPFKASKNMDLIERVNRLEAQLQALKNNK